MTRVNSDWQRVCTNLSAFIDVVLRGEKSSARNQAFRFPTPEFLIHTVQFPELDMQITENTIRKIYDFHGVNKHFLSRLPRLLNNENEQFISYIFKSHTQPNSRVVVSFEFVGVQPIIIAIAQQKQINTNEFVNEIASVYEKRDGLKAFERWTEQGLLIYKNAHKTLTEPAQRITIRHRKIRRT